MVKQFSTLRLLLWDHLSPKISSLEGADPKKDLLLFIEAHDEAKRIPHHVKKLTFLFSAMRHFAEELKERGFQVRYIDLSEEEKSLTSGVKRVASEVGARRLIATLPGEYRLLEEMKSWKKKLSLEVEILPDERFFASREEFAEWAKGKKRLLMENFYEEMRKKTGLLLTSRGEPVGGSWNYDKENRNPLPAKISFPSPLACKPDPITKRVMEEVKRYFPRNFGTLTPFWFGVTRKEAERALRHFIEKGLPRFGPYQDAMREGEAFLYHSALSQYLNAGLLLPEEVCRAVDAAYRAKKVPIESAEGYIRQILGWREYIRGIYWLKMPSYAKLNILQAKRKLPWFYWSGKTEMNCLKEVIRQTRDEAYSHHIQRLMITGNFALLIGVLPEEISEWYLSVYADAHEWVELPNTLGMSQFADGGLLATKPYISSGSYIDRMSNFCKGCKYDVKKKGGEGSCPFNYLYWDFLARHEKALQGNVRLAMPYRTLRAFSKERRGEIATDAKRFLKQLDRVEKSPQK